MQGFVTVQQAAQMAGMAVVSIHSRIRRGTLPATRINGKCLIIRKSDVERIIQDRR
jgi:predicted site-specific integrase-resolvase